MMTPEQEYQQLYERMYHLCQENGWGDPFSYARSREIHLAGLLGHKIADSYSGADAIDEDGGAESIAGIPLSSYSSEAAANIVAIFAQWGFSQLVLSCFLLLIIIKMRELIPLMLVIVALENILRGGVGLYKSLILEDAPPGAISPILGLVTLAVFFISIKEN